MSVRRSDIAECDGSWVDAADHAAEVAQLQAELDVLVQAVRAWKWHEALSEVKDV